MDAQPPGKGGGDGKDEKKDDDRKDEKEQEEAARVAGAEEAARVAGADDNVMKEEHLQRALEAGEGAVEQLAIANTRIAELVQSLHVAEEAARVANERARREQELRKRAERERDNARDDARR